MNRHPKHHLRPAVRQLIGLCTLTVAVVPVPLLADTATPPPPFTPFQSLVIGTSDLLEVPATRIQCTAVETHRFFENQTAHRGGVRVAVGDVNGDGVDDIITAAGPGGGPHVSVYSGVDGAVLHEFFAFGESFTGGVFVAVGDTNDDGAEDIIVGPDAGGGPHVRVFDGATGDRLQEFQAYDAAFTGGVRVATGDINGDGVADIITGAGPGGGPHVKVLDGVDGAELRSFLAFDPSFTGGVFVAGGQMNEIGADDLIVGGVHLGAPHVRVFDGDTIDALGVFPAFPNGFAGGVRVAIGDVNGDGSVDIITSPDTSRDRELIRVFALSGDPLTAFTPDVTSRRGGLFPGMGISPDGHPLLVLGGGEGSAPIATVFEMQKCVTPLVALEEMGEITLSTGDHTGDGVNDVIVGSGTDVANFVRVVDGSSELIVGGFAPYDPAHTDGVQVAAADLSGNDGHAEIVTGPSSRMEPEVRVFDGQTRAMIDSFLAYDPTFMGGVRVATGDVNGDGTADIITAPGPGAGPNIKVFDGTDLTVELHSFFAYGTGFTGGVFVAAGDVNGDGFADIITGPGAGGGPHIRIFDGTDPTTTINTFFAYDASFTGGVRVASGDVTGDGLADVIVTPPGDGPMDLRIFDGASDNLIARDAMFDTRGKAIAVCDRPRPSAELLGQLVLKSDGSVEVEALVPRGLYLHVESGPAPDNFQKVFDGLSLGSAMTVDDLGSMGQERWFIRSRGR